VILTTGGTGFTGRDSTPDHSVARPGRAVECHAHFLSPRFRQRLSHGMDAHSAQPARHQSQALQFRRADPAFQRSLTITNKSVVSEIRRHRRAWAHLRFRW
jgi:hypothetical protein